jgi:hypothetical protein
MKLTFRSESWFPFEVLKKDATFASSVGPHTVYPVGYSLERALQIYWRAKDYLVVATGNGTNGGVTQALAVNQNLPPRNAAVGTDTYYEVDGFTPRCPGDLVTGYGQRQIVAGSGTVSATGTGGSGTNTGAQFNLQVNLFYPEIFAADPVVRYAGQWWPAMSVSCSVLNTVTLSGGGELGIGFSCDTYNPASTTAIGTFTFFGAAVPVFCAGLAAGETRTISGAITVADEWA